MIRHNTVWDGDLEKQVDILLTPEEETDRDAEEQQAQQEQSDLSAKEAARATQRARISELLTQARSTWTTAERTELLELVARITVDEV